MKFSEKKWKIRVSAGGPEKGALGKRQNENLGQTDGFAACRGRARFQKILYSYTTANLQKVIFAVGRGHQKNPKFGPRSAVLKRQKVIYGAAPGHEKNRLEMTPQIPRFYAHK